MSLHLQKGFSTAIVTGLFSLENVKATIFVSQINRERMACGGKVGEKNHVVWLNPIRQDHPHIHSPDSVAVWPQFTHPAVGAHNSYRELIPSQDNQLLKSPTKQSQTLMIFNQALHVLALRPLTDWGTLGIWRQWLWPPSQVFLLYPMPALMKSWGQGLWTSWGPGCQGWDELGARQLWETSLQDLEQRKPKGSFLEWKEGPTYDMNFLELGR